MANLKLYHLRNGSLLVSLETQVSRVGENGGESFQEQTNELSRLFLKTVAAVVPRPTDRTWFSLDACGCTAIFRPRLLVSSLILLT